MSDTSARTAGPPVRAPTLLPSPGPAQTINQETRRCSSCGLEKPSNEFLDRRYSLSRLLSVPQYTERCWSCKKQGKKGRQSQVQAPDGHSVGAQPTTATDLGSQDTLQQQQDLMLRDGTGDEDHPPPYSSSAIQQSAMKTSAKAGSQDPRHGYSNSTIDAAERPKASMRGALITVALAFSFVCFMAWVLSFSSGVAPQLLGSRGAVVDKSGDMLSGADGDGNWISEECQTMSTFPQ